MQDIFTYIFQEISDWRRKITIIWQSVSISSKVLILIPFTIMASFLLALTFSILLTLVFVIPGLFLFGRWFEILGGNDQIFAARVAILVGDMKVPTFYAMNNDEMETLGFLTFFPVVGVIFGGIHCAGWFFDFPSSDEAMLWRVSSAVLTVSAVLIPFVMLLLMFFLDDSQFINVLVFLLLQSFY